MPFLHCKNKLKRAQNVQNSEFAYYASKSGKWIKQTPTPPFWGDVGVKKWSRFFDSGTRKPIFGHLKMGTFAKSAHFQVPKNGTSSARIQNLRPLFHANIPPKWWSRCLFYSFTTGRRRARAEQLEAAALRERQAQSIAFLQGRSLRRQGFGRLDI